MSVIFKKFIFDSNNQIIKEGTRILCEVENEAGDVNTIMMEEQNLFDAGYEILDNFNLSNKMESGIRKISQESEESQDFHNVSPNIRSNVDEWSDESTKFLLDKYADYLEMVGPMKQFKSKKHMWMEIAKNLETILGVKKTHIQCENRYKTILRRKRVSNKNNSTSGAKRIKVDFENEIKIIAAKDDSVEPEVLQSANNIIINPKNTNLSKDSNIKTKTKPGILDTLMEMHKEKEIKKQERHEEKIKLLRSFLEKENNKDS